MFDDPNVDLNLGDIPVQSDDTTHRDAPHDKSTTLGSDSDSSSDGDDDSDSESDSEDDIDHRGVKFGTYRSQVIVIPRLDPPSTSFFQT